MKLSKKNYKIVVKVLLTLIILAALFILYSSIYSFATAPLELKRFETNFIVGESAGFDLNNTIITFGRIPRGGEAEKNIIIANTHNFPIKIKVLATKNIADYIYFDDSELVLEPNSEAPVKLKVIIPENMEFGEYSGTILVKIYRAK
jgi:hypothetical protein